MCAQLVGTVLGVFGVILGFVTIIFFVGHWIETGCWQYDDGMDQRMIKAMGTGTAALLGVSWLLC
jgi:hypothetical protein